MTLASARGSGSAGPSAHLSKLPVPDSSATYTFDCAASPSDPPMYSTFVPIWTVLPSVREAGRVSSGGEACHGTTAPIGAGHGSVSLSDGQRLIGDQTSRPRSIVRLTVK